MKQWVALCQVQACVRTVRGATPYDMWSQSHAEGTPGTPGPACASRVEFLPGLPGPAAAPFHHNDSSRPVECIRMRHGRRLTLMPVTMTPLTVAMSQAAAGVEVTENRGTLGLGQHSHFAESQRVCICHVTYTM